MKRFWVVVLAAFSLILTSCSSSSPQQGGVPDTLVIALSDEPSNLNPIFGDLCGSIYGDHWPIFSSLLDYDRQLDLVPDLATEPPQASGDGRTVTVSLRDGVRWHDGEPFTADDVVFTYHRDPGRPTGPPLRARAAARAAAAGGAALAVPSAGRRPTPERQPPGR